MSIRETETDREREREREVDNSWRSVGQCKKERALHDKTN